MKPYGPTADVLLALHKYFEALLDGRSTESSHKIFLLGKFDKAPLSIVVHFEHVH